MQSGRDRVVVVGAGFAGITAARELAGKPVDVTLVDRHDYHLFQPFLYQVATGELEPQTPAYAVRRILAGAPNLRFRLAHATGVDWDRDEVEVDRGDPIPFDYLLVAAGATTNTLGIDGVREHCYPLKTLEDAERLRDHVLEQFEGVAAEPGSGDEALTFVVVGGGPTGVELAGALAELVHHVLLDDFPEIDAEQVRIVLIEALPHVLGPFSEESRDYAQRALESRGVEVWLDSPLEAVDQHGVTIADGRRVDAETVVWTAGVRAQPLAEALGLELDKGGRIVVGDDLSVPGRPHVFALGDIAAATDEAGDPYPQLAPVATQQAEHAVRQLALRRRGLPTEPFRYRDKGIMAILGRGDAIAELPRRVHLHGRPAWFAWLLAHLAFLSGLRNRLTVVINWVYNYAGTDRAARLIVRGDEPPRRTGEEADDAA